MAEILQEFTIVRRIIPPDSLPWPQLVLPSVIERLRGRYKFEEVGREPAQNDAIVFKVGEFSVRGTPQAVQLLAIEPNVVQTQTSGDAEVAESLFEDIKSFVSEVDKSRVLSSEYTKTFQTIAVAKLSVPFESIFNEKLRRYLDTTVRTSLSSKESRAEVALANLSFKVSFATESTDFVYLPKRLTLEPRSGSKLSDCIYYTQSPTDPKLT